MNQTRNRTKIALHRHPNGEVEVFDAPAEEPCRMWGAKAVTRLPPVLLALQPDGTTHVCHPVHGGCNHGFAEML